MNRRRISQAALCMLAAGALTGCVPTITVVNSTKIPVRVVVNSPAGSETFAPSPGESSNGDLAPGPYSVTVIPDADWTSYAQATRDYLNGQLANSQNLSGPQLLDLVRRLKDLAGKMQQMQNAAGSNATCGGKTTEDSAASATIAVGGDGKLAISCK